MQIVYILYIDKIVLNKTKYLTLNTGAMGHKTLQFKNAFYSLLSFNNKNIFTVEYSNKDFENTNALLRFFGPSGLKQFQ